MDLIVAHALPAAPLDALRELARGETELERLCRDRIASARAAGATWEQIGSALGMTRQAAREFFTRDARTAISDKIWVALSELAPDADLFIMAAQRLRSPPDYRQH